MAIARGTAIISVIRGRLGDSVFRVCDGKQIVSAAPLSVANPNTTKQQLVRDSISTLSIAWRAALLPAQRDQWETYALKYQANWNHPNGWRTLWDVSKDKRTGKDTFVLTNLYLVYCGEDIVLVPPLPLQDPSCFSDFAAVYNPGTDELTLTWADSGVHTADALALFKIQSQQKLFHKQLLTCALVADETEVYTGVTAALGAALNFADIEGSAVYLQGIVLNVEGNRSAPGETILVELSAGGP